MFETEFHNSILVCPKAINCLFFGLFCIISTLFSFLHMLFDSSYSYFLALDVEEDVDVLSLSITLDAQMPLVSRVGHSLFQFIANTYISSKRMIYMDS